MKKEKKFNKTQNAEKQKYNYPESTEMSSLSKRPPVVGFFFEKKEANELVIILKNILGDKHPTVEYMNSKINSKK